MEAQNEIAMLQQKIEFLELELDETKSREDRHRDLYEKLLDTVQANEMEGLRNCTL